MADAIWMLLSLSLSGTVLALLAALLYRLLHRVVPGALFYALWGLVLLAWCVRWGCRRASATRPLYSSRR